MFYVVHENLTCINLLPNFIYFFWGCGKYTKKKSQDMNTPYLNISKDAAI